MTGNKAHLANYQEFKGDFVPFGGSNRRITGKGKIKTGRLDFKDVYYVEKIKHYNLFSVSQMCDKKNKVVCEPKVWTDAPIIEEYESDSDNDSVSNVQEDKEKPSFAFTDSVKQVKTSRENIKEISTTNHSPKIEKQDRSGHTRKGLGYDFTRKA
uniref:Ribonuclease H-like domain-containing protein n=1 Tax=Tanacetum cinerariifolium TaxID=118510 RepID=A0A699KUH0_TANCI|nr:ribonuclease H-like domain-containing protein [Tanacetum cinerariifolium]